MSDLEIRAARPADEPMIMELMREEMKAQEALDPCFRLRPDADSRYALYLRNRMSDNDSSVFVAVVAGKVLGVAVGSLRSQETLFELRRYGYVSDLVVSATVRRRGVGRKLYERVALWFRSLGIRVIRLHVASASEEARSFWKAIGARNFLVEACLELESAETAGPPPSAVPVAEKPATEPEPEPAEADGD
ncbi:MAG TPA: GNAT family N-acetyltransferase [bacterium]|nr:GNAT family N-acetyltransferase [bacterium]